MSISTQTSIILTQIPIAIAILVAVYEVHKTKKILIQILEKLTEKVNKK